MNTIETLNQDVGHLKIVTKMINIDSCPEMARNGIVESGYYDLNLGSIGSPTKGFCHLPEGNFFRVFFLTKSSVILKSKFLNSFLFNKDLGHKLFM